MQVHQALRIQRGRIQIIRILRHQPLHRRTVRIAHRLQLSRVPRSQSIHIALLHSRPTRRTLLRPPDRIHRLLRPSMSSVDVVVVRPHRQRNTPQRHRRLRIKLRRPLERPSRLIMVEGVQIIEPLVEVPLCLRTARPYPMVSSPQPLHQHHRTRIRSTRHIGHLHLPHTKCSAQQQRKSTRRPDHPPHPTPENKSGKVGANLSGRNVSSGVQLCQTKHHNLTTKKPRFAPNFSQNPWKNAASLQQLIRKN